MLTSGLTGFEKPNRLAFAHALEVLGRPGEATMVGDSYNADVAGAEGAGIPAILVRAPDLLAAAHFLAPEIRA